MRIILFERQTIWINKTDLSAAKCKKITSDFEWTVIFFKFYWRYVYKKIRKLNIFFFFTIRTFEEEEKSIVKAL